MSTQQKNRSLIDKSTKLGTVFAWLDPAINRDPK